MATTISFPTAVSTNSITGSNAFADDGTNTTGNWNSSHADVIFTTFSSLSIPAGATINGIEVVVDGAGNVTSASPKMQVYNGSWSTALAFSGAFGRSNSEYDPGWGSSSNLWGLSWDATTAAAIRINVVASTILPGGRQLYWDWVKVRITYTAAAVVGMAKVNGVTDGNISKVNYNRNGVELGKINGITDTD